MIHTPPGTRTGPKLETTSRFAGSHRTAAGRPRAVATPWLRALLVALAALLLASACSTQRPIQQWDERFIEAGTRQDRGDFDGASARYDALEPVAPDVARARQVAFEQATVARKRGDLDEALEGYRALYDSDVQDSTAGRALYETAHIVRAQDEARGLELFERVVREYPETAAADFALSTLRNHHLRRDEARVLLELLERLHAAVPNTAIAHHIAFTRARVLEEHLRDDDAALVAYRALLEACGSCSLYDDARWQMALVYHRHQLWQPALTLLEQLASDTESSWFVGTYDSPYASRARFEMGLIYMLYLNDYERAARQFELYVRAYPNSTLTDDAAWNLVEIERLRGDARGHRRALERFVERHPDSRLVPRAQERLSHRQ